MICFVFVLFCFVFFFWLFVFVFYFVFYFVDGRNVVNIIYFFNNCLFFIDNLTLQTASCKHLINSSEIECFTLTCIGNANAFFYRRGLF